MPIPDELLEILVDECPVVIWNEEIHLLESVSECGILYLDNGEEIDLTDISGTGTISNTGMITYDEEYGEKSTIQFCSIITRTPSYPDIPMLEEE